MNENRVFMLNQSCVLVKFQLETTTLPDVLRPWTILRVFCCRWKDQGHPGTLWLFCLMMLNNESRNQGTENLCASFLQHLLQLSLDLYKKVGMLRYIPFNYYLLQTNLNAVSW